MIKLKLHEEYMFTYGTTRCIFIASSETEHYYKGRVHILGMSTEVYVDRESKQIFDTWSVGHVYGTLEVEDQLELIPQVVCDCGGYKTFGSLNPECHSGWCAINVKGAV